MHKQNTNNDGFTIVELLIVIVVIAILAAISIVAYTGVQQRATNTSIISAANQSIRLISAYMAANGNYPLIPANGNYCFVSAESSCTAAGYAASTSTTLVDNITTLGTLPAPVPNALPSFNGIIYNYHSTRTFNGASRPVTLIYSLRGEQQQCGLTGVTNGGAVDMVSSTTGWTSTSGGYTLCYISISGP